MGTSDDGNHRSTVDGSGGNKPPAPPLPPRVHLHPAAVAAGAVPGLVSVWRSALGAAKFFIDDQLNVLNALTVSPLPDVAYVTPIFDHATTWDGSGCITLPNPLTSGGEPITMTFNVYGGGHGAARQAHLLIWWTLPDYPGSPWVPLRLVVGVPPSVNQTGSFTVTRGFATAVQVQGYVTAADVTKVHPGWASPLKIKVLAQAVGEAMVGAPVVSAPNDFTDTQPMNASTTVLFA